MITSFIIHYPEPEKKSNENLGKFDPKALTFVYRQCRRGIAPTPTVTLSAAAGEVSGPSRPQTFSDILCAGS
jgi:hypothetical protein